MPTGYANTLMADLLRQYFYIAFLMGNPQDLPPGARQLQVGVLLNFVTYIAALSSVAGVGPAIAHATIDLACTALFIYTALYFFKRSARFAQSFGGLCGASAILNVVAIPIFLSRTPTTGGQPSALEAFSQLLLLVWGLSLLAHVLRHTFQVRVSVSVLVAVAYYMILATLLDGFSVGGSMPEQTSLYQVFTSTLLHTA